MMHIKCEAGVCGHPATFHAVEADGLSVVAVNYCEEHAHHANPDRVHNTVVMIIAAIVFVWLAGFAVSQLEGGAWAAPVILVLLTIGLVFAAWRNYPDAKLFAWLRRRAAIRLLRHGDWPTIHRSVPALILPFGDLLVPEMLARFRAEAQDLASKDGLANAAALLDHLVPGWMHGEVEFLKQQSTQFQRELEAVQLAIAFFEKNEFRVGDDRPSMNAFYDEVIQRAGKQYMPSFDETYERAERARPDAASLDRMHREAPPSDVYEEGKAGYGYFRPDLPPLIGYWKRTVKFALDELRDSRAEAVQKLDGLVRRAKGRPSKPRG